MSESAGFSRWLENTGAFVHTSQKAAIIQTTVPSSLFNIDQRTESPELPEWPTGLLRNKLDYYTIQAANIGCTYTEWFGCADYIQAKT